MLDTMKFRLYVAGDGPNSVRAVENLHTFCNLHLPGRHTIQIVDVCADPDFAAKEGILLTPTLVKYSPAPARKIIGSLSEANVLLSTLGISPALTGDVPTRLLRIRR